MRGTLGAALVLAALLAGSAARAEGRLAPEEARLLELVNAARAEAGLAPVSLDARLCDVARGHSAEMGEEGYFSHISPDGRSPGDRLRAASIDFQLSGENIAIDQTIEGAHAAFMASPGHRRNVLDPEFTYVGLGVVRTDRGLYVTESFIRPRPGFVATVPPPSSSPAAFPSAEPSPVPSDPLPSPCGRCDAPAPAAGPAAGFPEAPPLTPPPAFGWPAPGAVVVAPPPGTGIWVLTPGGEWQPVPLPWLAAP